MDMGPNKNKLSISMGGSGGPQPMMKKATGTRAATPAHPTAAPGAAAELVAAANLRCTTAGGPPGQRARHLLEGGVFRRSTRVADHRGFGGGDCSLGGTLPNTSRDGSLKLRLHAQSPVVRIAGAHGGDEVDELRELGRFEGGVDARDGARDGGAGGRQEGGRPARGRDAGGCGGRRGQARGRAQAGEDGGRGDDLRDVEACEAVGLERADGWGQVEEAARDEEGAEGRGYGCRAARGEGRVLLGNIRFRYYRVTIALLNYAADGNVSPTQIKKTHQSSSQHGGNRGVLGRYSNGGGNHNGGDVGMHGQRPLATQPAGGCRSQTYVRFHAIWVDRSSFETHETQELKLDSMWQGPGSSTIFFFETGSQVILPKDSHTSQLILGKLKVGSANDSKQVCTLRRLTKMFSCKVWK
ncbi:hypothetical protein BDK51DRAFT_27777 [Blyttiomyces helicus]|uniref:Uncharacterized protein n=1 Tax=Blyttiomyces helicus TaxID=388810 RepID=A0A4P9WQF7_9FUNG|nr:hypothetical protein BDK51DRAFT_27777 [Blyttiomyces helicus]|eukprot:RKO94832.1 hypothetical protein BDK51DRAFT_27777 [Blyttiomyces helicus]